MEIRLRLSIRRLKNIKERQRDANAQYNLGGCYENGTGVTVDQREAVKWYTRAAEAGYMDAQFNLGLCYYKGTGVTYDLREAVKRFTRAADAGIAEAQDILDHIYKTNDGIAIDIQESNT